MSPVPCLLRAAAEEEEEEHLSDSPQVVVVVVVSIKCASPTLRELSLAPPAVGLVVAVCRQSRRSVLARHPPNKASLVTLPFCHHCHCQPSAPAVTGATTAASRLTRSNSADSKKRNKGIKALFQKRGDYKFYYPA